jgi:hypothetical protein
MSDKTTFRGESTADETQLVSRDALLQLFEASPLPAGELLFNLGMYTRGSLLVKFLVMADLYQRVVHLPGEIHEYGVWWGQNLVLMENLRAIYEPFNKQRTIVGFDTFVGYTHPLAEEDGARASEVFEDATYATGTAHIEHLRELLEAHEGANVLGHVRGVHRLVPGDVTETAPQYFRDHPESLVALAYFDMGPYDPTKAALEAIRPHLMPGSVLLMDQLTWADSPGEAIALKEAFADVNYTVEKCALYPSKSIVTVLERPVR